MSGKRARYVWGSMAVLALLIAAGGAYLVGWYRADAQAGTPPPLSGASAQRAGAKMPEPR